MKIVSRISTEDLKCPHCNYSTNAIYWLEGTETKYCGNCFSEMLAKGNFEVIPKEVADDIKQWFKVFED